MKHRPNVHEYYDQDYAKPEYTAKEGEIPFEKLNDEERKWLELFNSAYYTGDLNELSRTWEDWQVPDASGKSDRQRSFDANNSRTRDLFFMGTRVELTKDLSENIAKNYGNRVRGRHVKKVK